MFQTLQTDTSWKEAATEVASRRRRGPGDNRGFSPRHSRKIVQKRSFLKATVVKKWISCCFSPDNTTPNCYFMPLICYILPSCRLTMRSEGRVFSAGTCRWFGAAFRAAGGLPLGHLDSEICYRDSLRAAPPRCVPALPKQSACVVWRWVLGGAVAMDRLNTSCCVHGRWEQRCVHGLWEKTTVVVEAEAPPVSIDETSQIYLELFIIDLETQHTLFRAPNYCPVSI